MHLSLKSSLGRQILTGIYVKDNRVLDLSTPFSELTFTLADKSGEGNDATLYTGRYASTDGVTDKAINADCSAAGSGNYYLTGKIKPVGTTAVANLNGSPINLTGLSAGVWQDFTSDTKTGITPDNVVVGWNGASNYSAADWSDVRLIDASDGSTVARWQLTESADGDLDGYPALDSSGNGYHGTHTGCAGGTGEAGILQTAGQDWNNFYVIKDFNFSSSTDGISFGANVAILGGVTLGAESDLFSMASSSLAGQHRSTLTDVVPTYALGSRVRVSGRIYMPSSNVDLSHAVFTTSSSNTTLGSVNPAADTWTDFSFIDTPSDTTLRIWLSSGSTAVGQNIAIGDVLYLSSLRFDKLDILIPESTTAGTDALGTAIAEPRVNIKQLNLFGDGEYAKVADADSLDLTTEATWELWGNFYGAAPSPTQAILSKTRFSTNERTVDIVKSSASADNTVSFTSSQNGLAPTIFLKTLTVTDKISHIVFTYDGATQTMVGYIDGVLTAFSATSGTVPTSIFANTQPYMIGARPSVDPASSFAPFKIGSAKIYNRALTADEVLQNYNAQKSQYGL